MLRWCGAAGGSAAGVDGWPVVAAEFGVAGEVVGGPGFVQQFQQEPAFVAVVQELEQAADGQSQGGQG
jgi:hypothetical protein